MKNMLLFFSLLISSFTYSQFGRIVRPVIDCPNADAGQDKTICKGNTNGVQIGTPALPGVSYYWTPSIGLSNPNLAQPIANPSATTTYTLTAINPSAANLITNGDFEQDYLGWATDYGPWANSYTCGFFTAEYGSMAVTQNPQLLKIQYCPKPNHTPGGTKMLAADGALCTNKRIWYQSVSVNTNSSYSFSGWGSPLTGHIRNPTLAQAKLRVRINGVDIISNFNLIWQSCEIWQQFSANWNSGNTTTAMIEIFNDETESVGNDFCIDDLSFTCGTLQDQVTVNVVNNPEVTPKGVLEVLTDCDNATSFQLTSNISQNCQWYEDGVAIPGANNPILTLGTGTYPTKLYTVENINAIGCISEPTQVIRTQVNTGCSINNVFNSPHYYCRGVSGIISQPVITGINPIYSWEFNYPYNSPIAPTQSNTSYVTFNSSNDHLVKAIAQAQDYTRFYFYGIDITPHLYQNPNNGNNYSLWFAPSCQSTGLTVTYGNSGYDNEYYDFGSGASIATYSSSGNVGLQSLIVYYSTPGTKTITVTYSNNSGDCNTILYAAPIDGSCRVVGNIPKSTSAIIEEKNDVAVFPNPASKFVNLVAQKSKMNELYVYSIDSKLVKSITIKGEVKYKLDVQDLRNGIYYLRIITSNGSFMKKIIVNN